MTVTAASTLSANAVANMTALPSQQMATAIAIDGRLLGLGGASVSGAGAGGEAHVVQLVQQAMETAGALEGRGGGGMIVTMPQGQTSTLDASTVASAGKKDASIGGVKERKTNSVVPAVGVPQVVQGPLFSQKAMPFNQMFLTSAGMAAFPQIYTMKVEKPVQVGQVSLESTSIELTGQVPIKKIDTQTMTVMKTDTNCESSKSNLNVGVVSEKDHAGKGVGGEKSVVEGEKKTDEVVRMVEEKGKEEEETKKKKSVKEKVPDGREKKRKKKVEEAETDVRKVGMEKEADKKEVESREGDTVAAPGFHGHSSADLMSAKLLLSLTEVGSKDWPVSSSKKMGQQEVSQTLGTSSPSSSPHTTSGGRKRKQKPIASAKPPEATTDGKAEPRGMTDSSPAVLPKAKRVRKPKKDSMSEEEPAKRKPAKGKGGVVMKSKKFTPQELLEILNIPPSSGSQDKGGVFKKQGTGWTNEQHIK